MVSSGMYINLVNDTTVHGWQNRTSESTCVFHLIFIFWCSCPWDVKARELEIHEKCMKTRYRIPYDFMLFLIRKHIGSKC